MKHCLGCGAEKSSAAFHNDRSKPDGLATRCRDCRKGRYAANAERERAASRVRYRENRERSQTTTKAWKAANPDRVRLHRQDDSRKRGAARAARRRAQDPEGERERVRRAHQAMRAADLEGMRGRHRRHQAAYLARKRGAFVEHIEPVVVLERDDGVCGICGGDVDPTNFHVDHVIPLALGGEHSYANVQTAHPLCNIRKGAKSHF